MSIAFIGNQSEAISNYLKSVSSGVISLRERHDRYGDGSIQVTAIDIKDEQGDRLDVIACGQTIKVCLYFEAFQPINPTGLLAGITVSTLMENPVFLQHSRLYHVDFGDVPNKGIFICKIKRIPLPPSKYLISYSLMKDNIYLDSLTNAAEIDVVNGNFFGYGEVPPATHGVCLVDAEWSMLSNK
jgi:lipopolysaccharide transport system ATP-binding protein